MPKISNFKIWKTYSLAISLTSCLGLRFIIMPAAKENTKKIKLFLHTTRSKPSSFHDLFNQNQTSPFPSILSWPQISFFTTSNKTDKFYDFMLRRVWGWVKKVEKEDLLAEQEMGIIRTRPKAQIYKSKDALKGKPKLFFLQQNW